MALTTAERNRRKRERKKKNREAQRQSEEAAKNDPKKDQSADEVEIEYVADSVLEDAPAGFDEVKKFVGEITSAFISDDDNGKAAENGESAALKSANLVDGEDDEEDGVSKRKLREMLRPSVAQLKSRVKRPDLVDAHDVTAMDPEFLIELKATPGTVPVPRHWGRKRKYLQGKRGFEKPPLKLPDFIVKTGITEIRDTSMSAEAEMSAKQKNRARVAPKMGAIDVDYRTLHDAFFKHQTKPENLTKFGETYYEGKETEANLKFPPGAPLSQALRDALGMENESSPPPWLLNMQRYGPPPSFPMLKIPGLNAPLPNEDCVYGYHPGGWGKPPVDQYNRPLYGNPFDPPGTSDSTDDHNTPLVTSDGKAILKSSWGALPVGQVEEEEEESSDEESEMEESSDEESEAEEETTKVAANDAVPTAPMPSFNASINANDDGSAPKQLYQVIDQKEAEDQQEAVFKSDVAYSLPGDPTESTDGAAPKPTQATKRKRADDNPDDLGKSFKF